ncbi:hypothetical protein PCC7418_2792 [Halothece sp. PCC 7418]|uniref:hypothetical protein n=1 Tax=Halothece sp. (strain PCC 7418) TaxID=65093 RepID=UPI0002A083B3|nr:hypothetical protein [Halothece sp. PCC 7418]AFZ44925.1 hypothetical protein PCC7418_2792 [Halothece sp. PCC 7418]
MIHPYNSEEIIQVCRNNIDRYLPFAKDYIDRGSLHSENLLMCALSKAVEARVIMESGRFKGQSTYCLGKFFEREALPIESIDLDRLRGSKALKISLEEVDSIHRYAEERLITLPNVKLHYGNSFKIMPRLLQKYHDQRVTLFIDGPKDIPAVTLAFKCLVKHSNIPIIFIHDCPKGSPGRKAMEDNFEYTFFSDNLHFLEAFSYLDETCQGEHWQPYHQKGQPSNSYGPTLGIAFPQQEDINRYLRLNPNFLERKSITMRFKVGLKSLQSNGVRVVIRQILENLRR